MTSLTLIGWIALVISLQLALLLAVTFARHWRNYRGLRRRIGESEGLSPDPVTDVGSGASAEVAWTGYRTFQVVRRDFEDASQSVCSFYLAPTDGKTLPPYSPGQFLTFRLDGMTEPAVGSPANAVSPPLVRCYSLSSAPDPAHYRVSIKRVSPPPGTAYPPGRSSSYFHDRVEIGAQLQVKAPAGHFRLTRSDSPVVLLAGGIGITPLLAMLEWLLGHQPGREVWLFYGVRHADEIAFGPHLNQLAASHPSLHLRYCLSDPQPGDLDGEAPHRYRGRIDLALLRLTLPLRSFAFFVCGPPPMMESLVPALEDWGVPSGRIHFEAFGPASVRRLAAAIDAAPASGATDAEVAPALPGPVVEFSRTGQRHAWDPQAGSLLEFAEAKGIAVESGCRAGGCGTCQTAILAGEIAYRQPPDFDPEPGHCLLCVSVPKTDLRLEA